MPELAEIFMRHSFSTSIIILILVISCKSQSTISENGLTDNEKFYCDSLKIDTSIIIKLRSYTDSSVEPFHYSLSKQFNPDGTEEELGPVHLQGLVFKASNKTSTDIVMKLRDSFKKEGYSIFLLENNFGIQNQPDVIGILKTIDKYKILKEIKTNGANYDIDPDSLINLIKVFDKKYSLDLVGASGDWCEFIINNEPKNWLELAKEAYKVCPDIVDQGTGTVDALAEEMKKTKHLYFWWD